MAESGNKSVNWSQLQCVLSTSTLGSLEELKFQTATPLQVATIPLLMGHKDVALGPVTGSGKTLAFVIPLIEIMMRRDDKWKKHEVGTIIVTPTRELALQIRDVVQSFISKLPFTQILMIGGKNPRHDIQSFQSHGGNIVVATPGRLEDLLSKDYEGFSFAAHVKSLEVLVLDEADRLLGMGFEKSITAILQYLPKQRRTGLFSATQTQEVEALMRAGLRNPVRVNVREKKLNKKAIQQATPVTLQNHYFVCEGDTKLNTLVAFLRMHKSLKHMLFMATCACVDYFSACLQACVSNVTILSLHGKMKQKRNKVFEEFRGIERGILVCSDLMARGIDVPDVDWVIQYDPPSSATSFIHRCGRTARIGQEGNALVLLTPTEEAYVEFLALNQKVLLQPMKPPPVIPDILQKIRKLALKDRAMYEKGMRAFVSFVQAYAKHECHLIFQLKTLDFAKLATGFALLKMPNMPELRHKQLADFHATDANIAEIPYKDKSREKQRQRRLQSIASASGVKRLPKRHIQTVAWSRQKEKKERKEKRKQAKATRKSQDVSLKSKDAEDDVDDSLEEDDEDELAKDYKTVKKLKKGKITDAEFCKEIGISSDDDDDETD